MGHSNGTSDSQRHSNHQRHTEHTDDRTSRSDRYQRSIEKVAYRPQEPAFDTHKASRVGRQSYGPNYEAKSVNDNRREEGRHHEQRSRPSLDAPEGDHNGDAKTGQLHQLFFTKEEVQPQVLKSWGKENFGDNTTISKAKKNGQDGYALTTEQKPAQHVVDAFKEQLRNQGPKETDNSDRHRKPPPRKDNVTSPVRQDKQTGHNQTRTNSSTKDARDDGRKAVDRNGSDDDGASPKAAKPKPPVTPNTRPEPPPAKPVPKPDPEPDPRYTPRPAGPGEQLYFQLPGREPPDQPRLEGSKRHHKPHVHVELPERELPEQLRLEDSKRHHKPHGYVEQPRRVQNEELRVESARRHHEAPVHAKQPRREVDEELALESRRRQHEVSMYVKQPRQDAVDKFLQEAEGRRHKGSLHVDHDQRRAKAEHKYMSTADYGGKPSVDDMLRSRR